MGSNGLRNCDGKRLSYPMFRDQSSDTALDWMGQLTSLNVINLKLTIWSEPKSATSTISRRRRNLEIDRLLGATHFGWIGAISTPITCAEGNVSAMSKAQMPVPVPRSRIRCGESPIGAKKCLSPSNISYFRCCRSCAHQISRMDG